MAGVQRNVAARSRRPDSSIAVIASGRRLPVLLVAGAIALFATGCASDLGGKTPCSTYLSMDNADQRSTLTSWSQQMGEPSGSAADISSSQRLADAYCSDPLPGINTIDGMGDSRPP
jgi:hypothetical protein